MRLIEELEEVRSCQDRLVEVLGKQLDSEGQFKIGFPSGSWDTTVKYNSRLWFTSYEIEEGSPRIWNGFGLAVDLDKAKSNNIVVEINIPTNGINRRVSGLYAIDEDSGAILLMHRGRVGGGREGIGKSAFVNWYGRNFVGINSSEGVEEALLVANLSGDRLQHELCDFVSSVKQFKLFATSGEADEASFLSTQELEDYVRGEGQKPKKRHSVVGSFERDPHIAELAKRRARGRCQLCSSDAPFKNRYGKPYLEIHHIKWLSVGGVDSIDNVVALCPNCHRKMHIVNAEKDVNTLMAVVAGA